MAWQRHGATVTRAQPRGIVTPGTVYDHCDGLWSDEPGRAMLLLTADCMPIALARARRQTAGRRDPPRRLARAPRRDRRRRRARARRATGSPPRSGRASARAATRWARRSRRRSGEAFGDDVVARREARSLDGRRARAPCRGRRAASSASTSARRATASASSRTAATTGRRAARESLPTSPDEIRERYARIREEVGADVTVVVATKYVSVDELALLADAGVEVVGENRAQDLEAKHDALRRRVPLALHRPPAEPEGEDRQRALRALPLARLRVGGAQARRSRRSSRST